jgi:hypothetical protein
MESYLEVEQVCPPVMKAFFPSIELAYNNSDTYTIMLSRFNRKYIHMYLIFFVAQNWIQYIVNTFK